MISSVRRGSRSRLLLALVLAALLVPSVAHAQRPASALPAAPADSVGMSLARLARLTAVFGKEIEDKKLPGAVMLVARKGKLVYARPSAARSDAGTPMTTDAIFRIYSMTKPIASVAAMILVEEGRLRLTDPVSKCLPAFKEREACPRRTAGRARLRPSAR